MSCGTCARQAAGTLGAAGVTGSQVIATWGEARRGGFHDRKQSEARGHCVECDQLASLNEACVCEACHNNGPRRDELWEENPDRSQAYYLHLAEQGQVDDWEAYGMMRYYGDSPDFTPRDLAACRGLEFCPPDHPRDVESGTGPDGGFREYPVYGKIGAIRSGHWDIVEVVPPCCTEKGES